MICHLHQILHHQATSKSSNTEILTRAQRIVLDLSNKNAQYVIVANELVLVLDYAPWCPYRAELVFDFAEAATTLRELGSSIITTKLDAVQHMKAASVLDVRGFPWYCSSSTTSPRLTLVGSRG